LILSFDSKRNKGMQMEHKSPSIGYLTVLVLKVIAALCMVALLFGCVVFMLMIAFASVGNGM
jgi:hypothetical protein